MGKCRCICQGKNITNVHVQNPVNFNEKQIFYHNKIYTIPVKDNDFNKYIADGNNNDSEDDFQILNTS